MGRRSITDDEIALIRAMLKKGMKNKDIQFFFNRPERAVNSGRITNIREGSYGPNIKPADPAILANFLDRFQGAADATGLGTASAEKTPEQVIEALFVDDGSGVLKFSGGEDDRYECKKSFSKRGYAKFARAVAGLSNNKGGVVLFGVKDKPDEFEACGLNDDQFFETDTNKFSQIIRSCFQPTPKFRVSRLILANGLKIGLIIVSSHPSKPVIAAKSEGGEVIEGAIYYRYPGETRLISYADLRALLDERDRATRTTILPQITRLLEIGPTDSLVANLADGTLEGGPRPIVMDEDLLKQVKLIREGEFTEKEGDPTLRIVGDVSFVTKEEKLVREEVTEEAILRDFLEKNEVAEPLAYLRQTSHEASFLLPIFYYLSLAGQTRSGAIASIQKYKGAKKKTKEEIVRRLSGKRGLFSEARGARLALLDEIRDGKILSLGDANHQAEVLRALTGLTTSDQHVLEIANGLVLEALNAWDGDRTILGDIRRAASRIDELVFGPLVSE